MKVVHLISITKEHAFISMKKKTEMNSNCMILPTDRQGKVK